MAAVSIDFPEADVRKLMRAMEYQSQRLGVPMREATQNAAKLVAYSAAAATTESKAYRKYERQGKGLFRVKSDRPGKQDFFVRAGSVRELKADRRVKIARRGLAKVAWKIIGAQIGGLSEAQAGRDNATSRTRQRANKFGNVRIKRNPLNPSVTLTNSLDYGMAAIKGGEGTLNNIVGKAARRMFRLTNAEVKKRMQTT